SVRKANGVRVRQPLAQLNVTAPGARRLAPFVDLVRDEVNVRHVHLGEDVNEDASYQLKLIPAALGPRLGSDMPFVMAAYKRGDWVRTDVGPPLVGGVELRDGEYELVLVPVEPATSAVLAGGGGVVSVDLAVSDELAAEGVARDVIRAVNQARRDAGLHVSDRIDLRLTGDDTVVAALRAHEPTVAAETLAASLTYGADGDGWHQSTARVGDGATVDIALRPVGDRSAVGDGR